MIAMQVNVIFYSNTKVFSRQHSLSVMNSSTRKEDFSIAFKGIPKMAIAIVVALVLVAVLFVLRSLRNPEIPWFAVSEIVPTEVGGNMVGPIQRTVDGRAEQPVFFDFSRGSVVDNVDPYGWDLEISRFNIRSNGGDGFIGNGGILDLGEVEFTSVQTLPEEGYQQNNKERDITNIAIDRWYNYSWINHLLTPKANIFAIRTADSRYAFIEILSYYCAGAQAGCLTFRYYYQGDGSTNF